MGGHFMKTHASLPTPVTLALIALFDAAFGGAFVAYSLAGIEGALALVAVAVALKTRRK